MKFGNPSAKDTHFLVVNQHDMRALKERIDNRTLTTEVLFALSPWCCVVAVRPTSGGDQVTRLLLDAGADPNVPCLMSVRPVVEAMCCSTQQRDRRVQGLARLSPMQAAIFNGNLKAFRCPQLIRRISLHLTHSLCVYMCRLLCRHPRVDKERHLQLASMTLSRNVHISPRARLLFLLVQSSLAFPLCPGRAAVDLCRAYSLRPSRNLA